MKKRTLIKIEDLASFEIIPYDIFNNEGRVVFYKGDPLNARVLSVLCESDYYKIQEIDESSLDITNFMVSKISNETSSFLYQSTASLLQCVYMNKKASIENIFASRDKIVDEVKSKIDRYDNLNYLRVYFTEYYISHSINVSILSTAIAIKMGYTEEDIKDVALASLLHDVGMVKIPQEILNKKEKLTPKEYEIVKLHAPLGYKIIKDEYGFPNKIALAVLDHQERYDGSGYLRGIQENKISRYAQIISLADVFDAASTDKIYSKAKQPKEILKELLSNSKCYNPQALYTLVNMVYKKVVNSQVSKYAYKSIILYNN